MKQRFYTFGDLAVGDWFKDVEGTLYMKIDEIWTCNTAVNVVCIEDGSTDWFHTDELVSRYIGTLTVSPDMFEKYISIMP